MPGRRWERDDARSTAEKIVTSIAAREGSVASELTPPLYNTVDPDALETLCESLGPKGRVTFEYRGYDVTIRGDGDVSIEE